MHARAADIIARLGLAPHPERGFFVESYRAPVARDRRQPSRRTRRRHRDLLPDHRRRARDLPASLAVRRGLSPLRRGAAGHPAPASRRQLRRTAPGHGPGGGRAPAGRDPGRHVVGTELAAGAPFCLVGCTVAPGFDFADFELSEGPELAARYPAVADRIARMVRAPAHVTPTCSDCTNLTDCRAPAGRSPLKSSSARRSQLAAVVVLAGPAAAAPTPCSWRSSASSSRRSPSTTPRPTVAPDRLHSSRGWASRCAR